MQSSSSLFPVALLSAERRGDLSEDVYRIKAANSPDASVELAVTRLGLADHSARGIPVILLHGSFANRRFWFSPKGAGLGAWLARAGFDVWIPEMRGHGVSPRNIDYRRNRVADYARYDLPVIGAFVREQSGHPAHWIGHSLGGISLAAALGGGYLQAEVAASVALFGSHVSRRHWPLRIPPVQWGVQTLLKRFEHLSGSRLKRGPEDEPVGIALEALRWQGLFGRFGEKGNDWLAGLGQVDLPLWVVAAEGDRQAPVWACHELYEQFGSQTRESLVLGRKHGFTEDFGHVEMLVSKAAQTEVWPLVGRWLNRQHVQSAAETPLELAEA
ncbi:alpha/beta hydrolase [Pseudomonas sp. HR96]|uniref:alpha/beta hydrolase n=1 Tax=Pseudomonas sp. HR96 TaxID=1027966 RepID=UPI002A74DD3A|nr:alpha/beta hydrolase [Pseudomonas sp. HR96]WPO98532.1 alpha/beta hydrolase [Pseudomonas sp. HR96]